MIEWRGAYLNADTALFIPVQYDQIVIEDFPTSLTLNQKTYSGWVAARYASGKTDYYGMNSLKPFSGASDNFTSQRITSGSPVSIALWAALRLPASDIV